MGAVLEVAHLVAELRQANRENEKPGRIFSDRSNPFVKFDDKEFRDIFQMSKTPAITLIDLLTPDLKRDTNRDMHCLHIYLC